MTTPTTTNNTEIAGVSINDMVLAGIIPNNTPKAQVEIFAAVCKETGLSPMKKEIYLVNNGGKFFNIVSIGGMRSIAEKTGAYLGKSPIMYDLKSDGSYKTMAEYEGSQRPKTVSIIVYKNVNGTRCEFPTTIAWSEYSSGFMAGQKPFTMLNKTVESHALRAAFATLSNFYEESEIPAITGQTESAQLPKSANQTVPIDKVKETLNPEHPKWNEAVKYMSGANAKIQKVLDKYEISETDIEYLQTLNLDVTA